MMIRRKNAKRVREDKIRELPEPLIHHIFSFIPIKYVVSTSVLSTKWRYLWISIPIIDFRNWRPPYRSIRPKETEAFIGFVDRVLSFRQGVHSPRIKKFCLDFDYCFDSSGVSGWIYTVLQHKIEELVLNRCHITLPPCLFVCESLTILEINGSLLGHPESVNFPKLKILRLGVKLEDEHLIPKLLSNSPVLEELSLQGCWWDIQHLSICGPNLKQLFINGLCTRDFDVQINAPNLQSFKYSSVLAKDFVLHNFFSLLDAEIVLSRSADMGETGELGSLATKLFCGLSYVKRLTMSDNSLKLLSYQDHFYTSMPSFYNLIHLEIMSAGVYDGYGCRDAGNLHCWIVRILLNFLHISPNLESLVFVDGFRNNKSTNSDGWSLDLIPPCLLLHLKSVEFRGFFWNEFEKDLIKLFLKNARVLQRVRITISGRSSLSEYSNYKKQVIDEMSLFPRSSDECVIHVS
ncbi:hypothetical protein MKX03_025246 [Papaver bracteatum]|nr:hypothetical protein MKX03_025246 [Papaver bracteatum]